MNERELALIDRQIAKHKHAISEILHKKKSERKGLQGLYDRIKRLKEWRNL